MTIKNNSYEAVEPNFLVSQAGLITAPDTLAPSLLIDKTVPYGDAFEDFKNQLNKMKNESESHHDELQYVIQYLTLVKTLLVSQELHLAIPNKAAVVNAMKRFQAHRPKNRTFSCFVACLESEIANAERPERYRGLLVLANEYSQQNKLSLVM